MAQLPYARYYPPAASKESARRAGDAPPNANAENTRSSTDADSDNTVARKRKRGRDGQPAEVEPKGSAKDLTQSNNTISIAKSTAKKSKSKRSRSDSRGVENEARTTGKVSPDSEDATINKPDASINDQGVEPSQKELRKEKKRKKREREAKIDNDGRESTSTTKPQDGSEDTTAPELLEKYASIFEKYRKSAQAISAEMPNRPPPDELKDTATKHGLEPIPQPEREAEPAFKATYRTLPSWLAEPIVVHSSTSTPFSEVNLSPDVLENLTKRRYSQTMAIQAAVLPLLLPGPDNYDGDLCISAATGSGKTIAYVVPMIEDLKHKAVTQLRGLVVVPTRELVQQVREVIEFCAAGTSLGVGSAVGSKSKSEERAILVKRSQVWDELGCIQLTQQFGERLALEYDKHSLLLPQDNDLMPGHVPEYLSAVDILICTPGRLVEHIQHTEGFSLASLKWLIIDEADRLLDQSFQEWVTVLLEAVSTERAVNRREKLLSKMWNKVDPPRLRKVILSATMTRDLSKLGSLKLRKPSLVAISDSMDFLDGVTDGAEQPKDAKAAIQLPSGIMEWAVPAGSGSEKPLILLELLHSHLQTPDFTNLDSSLMESSVAARQDPKRDDDDTQKQSKILIFTRSDEDATRLSFILHRLDKSFATRLATLTKSASIREQKKALNAFHRHEISILVASDRVSRGIDVKEVSHVVNYDMPHSLTSYVHRVGRTARAGATGEVWTLFTDSEARWFWNDIARGGAIDRQGRKVERLATGTRDLGPGVIATYETALKELQSAVLSRDLGK